MKPEDLAKAYGMIANIDANLGRLFAKLDVGTLAIAAAPGLGVAVRTEEVSVARLRALLPDQLDAFPEQVRREMWQAVADEVGRLDAISSPDELMRLPFEVLLDAETRALLAS